METLIPAPEVRLSKARYRILWLALIALAALLRLGPVTSGLPYIDYVDEGYALHQAIDLLNRRTLDPGWYGYPSLPAYLTAGVMLTQGGIYRHFHDHSFRDDLPREESRPTNRRDNYDIISPPELIVVGRIVAACLSIGGVILSGVIATRLGGSVAGLLAMLIMAVCPALVSRASNVIVDTFATFFALLAIYFCDRLRSTPQTSWPAFAAGLAAGLAFASKYNAGAVFVVIIVLIVTLPVAMAGRARLSLLASLGLLTGIGLGAPATLLKWPAVWRDVAQTVANYQIMASSPGYFGQAVSTFELGWPLVLAGCAGVGLMLRRTPTRSTALGWGIFALLLLAVFGGRPFQPFRNLLPLVPPFCIAAAIAFSDLIAWMRGRTRSWGQVGFSVVFVGVCVGPLALSSFRQIQRRSAQRDTRIQAIDWLQQNAAKEATVLGIRELAILPAEWKRTSARSSVVPWSEASDLLRQRHFDYIVTGEFDLRYAPDPAAWTAYLDRWKTSIAALPVERDFGQVVTPFVPYLWRTNDQRILILKGSVP